MWGGNGEKKENLKWNYIAVSNNKTGRRKEGRGESKSTPEVMGECQEYSQLWRLAVVCDELSSEQASGAPYSKPNDDHEPRRTSRGRVKRIVTMSSSIASEAIPLTFNSSYRADPLISLKVEQAVGDKRSAPDT